jgi:Phosphotransferase enzyme family
MSRGAAERGERAIAVSRWLVEQGFPATEPLAVDQPAVIEGWAVTCWQHYPQGDRQPPEPWCLGELLRRLHVLPALPGVDLPRYTPLASMARQAESTAFLAAGKTWLLGRREELLAAYHCLEFPLGHGRIHGDAYPGNLLWNGAGVVLGDWDEASFGPRELDLVDHRYPNARGRRGATRCDKGTGTLTRSEIPGAHGPIACFARCGTSGFSDVMRVEDKRDLPVGGRALGDSQHGSHRQAGRSRRGEHSGSP